MRSLHVFIYFMVLRSTKSRQKKWLEAKGYDCGGENVTANGGLEDGTPYMWSSPPPTRILTCQAKCAASKGCTAFVWLSKESKCLWRKNISPSTVWKKQGHNCFSETRPSDFSFVHEGRCTDPRDNFQEKFAKSRCAHSRAECTNYCVQEPTCGFFAFKDSDCSVPGASANCFLYGTSSGCHAGATKNLFPEFKTFQLKLGACEELCNEIAASWDEKCTTAFMHGACSRCPPCSTNRDPFGNPCRIVDVDSPYKLRWEPPPVLYTIPGSGNTMTRLLIDAVLTGYHSTSIYGDHSLVANLPGELWCGRTATVIKAHPIRVRPAKQMFKHHQHQLQNRCSRCIPEGYSSAVVVTRDPMRAFFSTYQLWWTQRHQRKGNAHTNRIPKAQLNHTEFVRKLLANAGGTRMTYSRDYQGMMDLLDPSQYIFVRFRDLVSHNVTTRRAALRKIIEFLTVEGTVVTDEALDAAMSKAESKHRPPPTDKDVVFSNIITSKLVDRYWEIVGDAGNAFGMHRLTDAEYGIVNASTETRLLASRHGS